MIKKEGKLRLRLRLQSEEPNEDQEEVPERALLQKAAKGPGETAGKQKSC